jgi:hypothetical protein
MAIKVELAERDHIHAKQGRTGISVMLSFVRFLDRVRPQSSLAIALAFSVVWIAALDYGLLRLVW